MCMIIDIPSGVVLDEAVLERCYKANKDGWGIMWSHGGEIYSVKDTSSFEDFMDYWQLVPVESNRAVHFRIRTHGEVDQENCHPFTVLEKTVDGRGLMMMHNGFINTEMVDKARSDTWNFVTHELAPLMREAPSMIDHQLMLNMLQEAVSPSRVLLMNDEGGRYYLGKWHDVYRCRFSHLGNVYPPYAASNASNWQRGMVWCSEQYKYVWPPGKSAKSHKRHRGGRRNQEAAGLYDYTYDDRDGYYENGVYHRFDEEDVTDNHCAAANVTEAAEQAEDAKQTTFLPTVTPQTSMTVTERVFQTAASTIKAALEVRKANALHLPEVDCPPLDDDDAEIDMLLQEMTGMNEREIQDKLKALSQDQVSDLMSNIL